MNPFLKAALLPYPIEGVPGCFFLRRLSVAETRTIAELVKADPVHGMAHAIALGLLGAEAAPVFSSAQEALDSLTMIQLSTIGQDLSAYSHGSPLPSRGAPVDDAAPGEAPPAS